MDIAYDPRITGGGTADDQDVPETSGISDLLQWNNLAYTMPVTNSVAAARNIKPYYPDQQNYRDGDTVVFTVQTGAQFVDWSKSWLEIELEVKSPERAGDINTGLNRRDINFGAGSICNLIKSVVVTSRSGVEVQRIEEFNRWRVLTDRLKKSDKWMATYGEALGYKPKDTATNTFDPYNSGNTISRIECAEEFGENGGQFVSTFNIPMSQFAGVFESDQLMPSNIASGLRIELRLENGGIPFFVGQDMGADLSGNGKLYQDVEYEVSCKLFVDTTLLNDAAMREIRAISASNGLEYVYKQVYHQKEPQAGVPQTNMVISKAVSRALQAMAAQFLIKKNSMLVDNFITQVRSAVAQVGRRPSKIIKQQWRLGSQYYPHQYFTTLYSNYQNLIYCCEATTDKPIALSTFDFQQYLQIAMATFEKSALLRYSGISINNSRTLSIDAEFLDSTLEVSTECWLEYVSVGKAFLNNIVVSI